MLHWDTVHTDLKTPGNGLKFTGLLCPGIQKKSSFIYENIAFERFVFVFAVGVKNSAIPSVLCNELKQVFSGNLIALLLEERREPRFPIHHALVVFKY